MYIVAVSPRKRGLAHLSMRLRFFFSARTNLLTVPFCSQRSFVDCVRGRRRRLTTNERQDRRAIGIHPPRSASTKDTHLPYSFVTFATLSHPPARSSHDYTRTHFTICMSIAIRSWNQYRRDINERKAAGKKKNPQTSSAKRKRRKVRRPDISYHGCMLCRYLIRFHTLLRHNLFVKYTVHKMS